MIVIFCASKIEILNLLKKIKIVKRISSGQIRGFVGIYNKNKHMLHGEEILILFTGMGKKNAARAADFFISEFIADNNSTGRLLSYPFNKKPKPLISHIIVTGFGGSLVKDIKIKDIVLINEMKALLNLKSLARDKKDTRIIKLDRSLKDQGNLTNNILPSVPLVTVEEVITDPYVKKEISRASDAKVLDMETFWIAERLSGSGIPQTYLRVVSDDLENNIPAFLNLNPTGSKRAQQNPFYRLASSSGIFFRSVFNLMIRPSDIIRTIKFLNNIFSAQKTLSKVIEEMINDML